MKHNTHELIKAMELASSNFNNLPIEMRKALASPFNRILENDMAIAQAERHLANLKKRRGELQDWLMDWYNQQIKEESR